MTFTPRKSGLVGSCIIMILLVYTNGSIAQTGKIVWADEFDGAAIDRSKWKFGSGLTNDNIHYYTDRAENARIADGKLRIIALKESYQGSNYTSALIETKSPVHWRYGRMEASIKLPGTPGFVPAFWMLPADNIFGWWPFSGEIDIMEYPTTEGNMIYGTVHTRAYNLFSGESPRGGTVHLPDAESQFHLYAVEWTMEQIDFYVDARKYFSFSNDLGDFKTWPFNQPFYIILNLAVGGGWVGQPDETTVFPAVMEIDYIRVYQYEKDMAVTGPDFIAYHTQSATYALPAIGGAVYSWSLPGHAEIVSGQNTSQIDADWSIFGGVIHARLQTAGGSYDVGYPVDVSCNLLKNPGFEKGVKYWSGRVDFPAAADMRPDTLNVHQGKSSLSVHVKTQGTNAWDVQVAQRNLSIDSGKRYQASFWAKTDGADGRLNAAIIDSSDYALYAIETFTVTGSWARFELVFTAKTSATVGFNIDLGSIGGRTYLDDFIFTTSELSDYNQLSNADFEGYNGDWHLNSFFPAEAGGSIQNGEYAVSIDHGGTNAWDVHLGQSNISLENGKEYTLSFDAHAAEARTISVVVGKNSDPWTVYGGSQIFSLTAAKQAYARSFIMAEPSDHQARFGFDVGASAGDVFFDNVFLSAGKASTMASRKMDSVQEFFKLYQNYPNPSNPATTIIYRLAESSAVSLKIFNGLGQETATLVDAFQETGEYEMIWTPAGLPSGNYFCRLQAGDFSETKKVLLKK